MPHQIYRISNEAYTYSTDGRMWDGETVYTAREMIEREQALAEAELEAAIARRYGDCGQSIVGTGDYEQLLAEEARAGLDYIPAPPMNAYGF